MMIFLARMCFKFFPLTIAITLISAYVIYRLVFKKRASKTPKILKKDFEKDKVYLYEFPRLKTCRNLSPFCIKLETFLRIHNIPHEIVYTFTKRSRNGTLPFIELNGEHIVDSDFIEIQLKKHFKIPELSKEQETQSVLISRFADNHLFYVLLRYKGAAPEFFSTILTLAPIPGFLLPVFHFILSRFMGSRIQKRVGLGIGNFNDQEHEIIFHRDLKTIENLLNNGKFIFGDQMSSADATVFGQLSSVYHPFDSYIRQTIDKEYPRLKQYLEDVIEEVYPNDFVM